MSLVPCPAGTFYDSSSKTCSTCSRGSYQPHSAQEVCTPCPFTQTTARIGAKDLMECEGTLNLITMARRIIKDAVAKFTFNRVFIMISHILFLEDNYQINKNNKIVRDMIC